MLLVMRHNNSDVRAFILNSAYLYIHVKAYTPLCKAVTITGPISIYIYRPIYTSL